MKEVAIKDLSKDGTDSEQCKAIARLNSIPSEIETMLFLLNQGKIIFHSPGEIQRWRNKDNGVDISFADGKHFPGLTDMAFIDVKNVKLKENGTNFPNLYIEIAKYGEEKYAWGKHYTDGSTNRYIAYVRDGKKFGGKLATETEAFSLEKTERENTIELIKYYAKHQELLTHDIYIVRGDDIGKEISDKWETNKGKGYFTVQLANWRLKYPLMEVSRTAEGWTVKHTGKGTFDLTTATQARQIHANDIHTAEIVEKNIDIMIEDWKHAQLGGLNENELLKIYGLILEKRIIRERVT